MNKLPFAEIKNRLESELRLFTIDDLLVKSPLQTTIELFKTTLNWNKRQEIESYFAGNMKYINDRVAVICYNKEISDNLKVIEQKLQQVENMKHESEQREKKYSKVNLEINALLIKNKITQEEFDKKIKINEEYRIETIRLKKLKVKTDREITELRIDTRDKQGRRKRVKEGKNIYYGNEQEAFKWLYSMLFFKEVEIKEVEGYKKTDTQLVFGINEIKHLSKEEKINYEKTSIDYELHTKDADIKNTLETLVNYSSSSVTLPFNWKDIMKEIFYTPVPDYFGTLNLPDIHNPDYHSEENKGFCFQKDKIIRSHDDEKILLQLKMAALSENFLITTDKKILFSLYGNATAKVTMRRKGEMMKKFFTAPLEIVINQWEPDTDNKTKSYFLISQEYVIEVDFINE